MKKRTIIGLDLGQANDYTAIVILEHVNEPDRSIEEGFHVVHLERMRGVSYTKVTTHVLALYNALCSRGEVDLVVDNTGVGRGIVDTLTAANPVRINIHGGNAVTGEYREFGVPKRDLIGALVVAFESGALKIANGLELGPVLATEAVNLKAKITASGHTELKADWREGEHDDLALGLACAVWWAKQFRPFFISGAG